ncbi:MAG: hypothetical protein K6G10_01475 [Butyrivibrio sp.]|nr:hypothetical protein [Butyrivibrio sp.]
MGYGANATGGATLKKGVSETKVVTAIKKHYKSSNSYPLDFDFGSFGSYTEEDQVYMNLWDSENYHEEDTEEFLKVIAPFVEEGVLNYHGEDDSVWHFIFNPKTGQWDEEDGTIVYGCKDFKDETLIKELVKRGYKVEKIS